MSATFSHSITETADTNSRHLAQMMGRTCWGFWMLLCCFLKSYVQSLKTIYNMLSAIYNMLSAIYNMLSAIYNMLSAIYNMLNAIYNMLSATYNMLSATYNMLSATYNMLSTTYNSCKISLHSIYFNCHKKKSYLNIYINILKLNTWKKLEPLVFQLTSKASMPTSM